MHAFLMPPSLNQLETKLWIRHILNIVLLAFIMNSQSGFLHPLRDIIFSGFLDTL
jgi:hypothetical protein